MNLLKSCGSGIVSLSLLLSVMACNPVQKEEKKACTNDVYEGVMFDMPKVEAPVFKDNTVSILDFGAIGDGKVMNTEAFAKAIDAMSQQGGGKVIVPRGIWLTGPIVLKSNINLHVEEGALVLFSDNKDLYPIVETSFEGLDTYRCQSPLSGKGLENIAITGKGVFDGMGQAWRHVKKGKLTSSQWNKLVASGGVLSDNGKIWFPSESYKKALNSSDMNVPDFDNKDDYKEMRDFLRPVLVSLINCKNVLLDGPVFQNSPSWNVHPLMCTNLIVRNVTIRNPWYSQNGDGLDVESCKNVLLYDSSFDVGDDAICIKSGKDKDGRDRGVPNENMIVKDCIVYHGHGGVTVGSEMSGGVKNLHVDGCTFIGTDVGLRFKSTRGRGGVVEGVYITNIDMMDIPTNAISFNLYYGGLSVSEMMAQKKDTKKEVVIPAVTEETPQFKDIVIKNVNCKGALQGIYLQGLPEMNLENVSLENINMTVEKGLFCMDAKGVTLKDIHLTTNEYPSYVFYNTKDLKFEGFEMPKSDNAVFEFNGTTSDVQLTLPSGVDAEKLVTYGADVNKESFKILN